MPEINKINNMEGDGMLQSVAHLAYEAIKHIIPGLLAKGGEEVGSTIGKLVSQKIYTEHPTEQKGSGISANKKTISKQFATSSSAISQGITSMSGSGFVLAGDTANRNSARKGQVIKFNERGLPIMPEGEGLVKSTEQSGSGKATKPPKPPKAPKAPKPPKAPKTPKPPKAPKPPKPLKAPKLNGKGNKLAGDGINLTGHKFSLSGLGFDLAGHGVQQGNGVMEMNQTGNGLTREIITNMYNNYYKMICKLMGDTTTDTQQINQIGKQIFKTNWGGAIPSDYVDKLDMTKYYVVNYDSSEKSGSHWTACTNNLLFDSLSFDKQFIDKTFKKYKLKYINQNIVQDYSDSTCGQHSLTFLLLYSAFGDNILIYL